MAQKLPFRKGQWVTVQRTGGGQPIREAKVRAIYTEPGFTRTDLVLELEGADVPSELVRVHETSPVWKSRDDEEFRGEYRIAVREKKVVRVGSRCFKV